MESLKNLPPFYVGEKVVYLSGKVMPKNSIHIVKSLHQHPCGCWSITTEQHPDVDGKFKSKVKCYKCDNSIIDKPIGKVFFRSNVFAPLQQSKFPLIEYNEVIEREQQLITSN